MNVPTKMEMSIPGVARLEPVYGPGQPTAFQYRQVNEVLAHLLGKEPDSLIGCPLTDPFLSLSKQAFADLLEGVRQSAVPHQQVLALPGDERILGLSIQLLDQQLLVIVQPVSGHQLADGPLPPPPTENQYHQLLERHQIATRAGGLGIWETDFRTGQASWDEQMWAIHQLAGSPRPLTVAERREMVHPDDRLMFVTRYEADMASKADRLGHNFRIVKPDGTVRHIHMEGRIFRDQHGQPIRALGVSQDVTEQRVAEQHLRASEEQFHGLVDQLEVIVFQTDSKGCWTYLNPAWQAITGFSVEATLGHFFVDSIMPVDQARCQELLADIQAGNWNLGKPVIQYIHQSEGYRWLEVQARVLVNDQQELIGTSGILTDITQRKRAEEALQQSEQRFRELAENVDELFWIRDVAAGRISYINPVYETFTGIPVEEVYGNPMSFFSAVIPADQPLIKVAMQSQDVSATYQVRIRHRTGRLRWLTVRKFSIFNEQGQLTRRIGVATDTTALIEKGQLLEESLRKEQALTALQSQFITTASHEFRTPLMAISSSAELLQHYLSQLPTHPVLPGMARHLTAITTKVQLLNELIGDTLTISKLEEGQIKVCWQALEVVDFCQTLMETTFGERPDGRQVDLSVVGEIKPVETDSKLLDHILVNLLSNAFKFSTQNPSLTIRFDEPYVELVVSDQGIGIPADEVAHVFGKFFRARNAAAYQGTGLGLVICQEYASLLEGQLAVTSEAGVGSRFTLRLALHRPFRSGVI